MWQTEAHTLVAALPDGRVAVLDGLGHAAEALAPEPVADQLPSFPHEPR